MTTDPRTEAHEEMRKRGMTDDIHATSTCIVTIFFWLLAAVSLASAYV